MNFFLKTTAGAIGLALLMAGPASAAPIESPLGDAPAAPPGAAVANARADRDGDRIEDTLGARIAASRAGDRFDVIVLFEGPDAVGRGRAAAGPFAVTREFSIINGFQAQLTAPQIRGLSRAPGLFRISGNGEVTAHDIPSNADMGVPNAQNVFPGDGTGVTICVIDTGIDASHEQFDTKGPGGGPLTSTEFFDAVLGEPDPYDDHGHGSHTSGIAAGDGDGVGLLADDAIGVAPGASLLVAKVLSATGGGTDAQVIAGIGWCAHDDQNADILTMSLGGGGTDGTDPLSVAVNCVADPGYEDPSGTSLCSGSNAAKIIVVSAGNSGADPSTIGTPGVAALAITVGSAAEWSGNPASNWQDDGLYLNIFSSRGPVIDIAGNVIRKKPDIVGPGSRVLSAYVFDNTPNNSYGVASGTSMSTPFVAGVIALMLQVNPDLGVDDSPTGPVPLPGGLLPHEKVRNILALTAEDRGPTDMDNEYGHGVIDAYSAVAEAGVSGATAAPGFVPNAYPVYTPLTGTVANSGNWTWEFTVTADMLVDPVTPIAGSMIIDGIFAVECWIEVVPGECWLDITVVSWTGADLELILEEKQLDGSWSQVVPCDPDVDPDCDPDPGWVTLSECPAGAGECNYDALYGTTGALGRAELVHFLPQSEGTYRFRVWPFFDGVSATGGDFDLEISGVPGSLASFTFACTDLDCDFADTSSDPDGVVTIVSWSWDFGDEAGTSTAQNPPLYSYADGGSYTVTLTVTDSANAEHSASRTVTVSAAGANNLPVAGFTRACADLACTFTDDSTDADGTVDIVTRVWNFDGAAGSVSWNGLNPTFTYDATGEYTVMLTVTDAAGAGDSASETFTVTGPADMVAHIGSLNYESIPRPKNRWDAIVTVRVMDATGVPVPAGAEVDWAWSNGASGTGTCITDTNGECTVQKDNIKGNVTSVTFAVTMVSQGPVDDYDPDFDPSVESIIVYKSGPPPNQAPVASFTVDANPCIFLSCSFTDTSVDPDGSVVSWSWDFGDDTAGSTLQNPIHFYVEERTYVVTLTVTDDDGDMGFTSEDVPVVLSPPSNFPPTATITAPGDGSTFTEGDPILFTGTASDTEDAGLTGSSLSWTSDGVELGSGESFSVSNLSLGDHTIIASVTDSDGENDADTISITVVVPSAITLSANSYKVKGMKTVDLTWIDASGANVDITRNGAPLATVLNNGSHKDEIGKGGGTYTYQVCEADSATCSNTIQVIF